jgi:hypothetical protein
VPALLSQFNMEQFEHFSAPRRFDNLESQQRLGKAEGLRSSPPEVVMVGGSDLTVSLWGMPVDG